MTLYFPCYQQALVFLAKRIGGLVLFVSVIAALLGTVWMWEQYCPRWLQIPTALLGIVGIHAAKLTLDKKRAAQ